MEELLMSVFLTLPEQLQGSAYGVKGSESARVAHFSSMLTHPPIFSVRRGKEFLGAVVDRTRYASPLWGRYTGICLGQRIYFFDYYKCPKVTEL